MIECDQIPIKIKTSPICIHCCSPFSQSNNNNAHRSSPDLSSSSTRSVTNALYTIFKLNYLKPFDPLEWEAKDDEQYALLCINCNEVLTNLYQLYNDFIQLGHIDSLLTKKLARLDEVIDCHQQKSIQCDLVATNRAGNDVGEENCIDVSSPIQSSFNQRLRKQLLIPRQEKNKLTTATATRDEEEFNEDDDYSPSASDFDPQSPEIHMKVDDDELELFTDIVESEDDDDEETSKSTRRKISRVKNANVGSLSKITTKSFSRVTKTPRQTSKDKTSHPNEKNKNLFDGRGNSRYFAVKARFANPCWYCRRTDFLTPADCLAHTKKEHLPKLNNNNSTLHVCDRCSKISCTDHSFASHLKWCKLIPSGVIMSKQFQCEKCSKSFATQKYLDYHNVCHTNDRHFSCDLCEFRAKSNSSLYCHKRSKHNQGKGAERGIKCDECDSHLKHEYALNAHKKAMHTAEGYKKYREKQEVYYARAREKYKANSAPVSTVCADCKVDLLHPIALYNHRRTVHGDIIGEFTCDTCGKSFKCRRTLRLHTKTVHSDSRPFVCDACGKSFKGSYALKAHVDRTHRGRPIEVQRENQREESKEKTFGESIGKCCAK